MPDDRTSIWVSDDLWRELHTRKNRGDSFEDVIWRALNEETDDESEERAPNDPDAVADAVADAINDADGNSG